MKTVILGCKDGGGVICVAKDHKSAFDYLIDHDWIYDDTEICVGYDKPLKNEKISEVFGKDWRDKMTEEDIRSLWIDGIFFYAEEVVGTE